MPLTICTFNVNNLYARYKFGGSYPGDRARKSLVGEKNWGYLPQYGKGFIEIFNGEQRQLEADVMTNKREVFPDVICLQEVESLLALRKFNEQYLKNHYRHALLIDSRDFRQIDVGVLSNLDILDVRSHVDDPDNEDSKFPWLFSRDCLEVEFAWPNHQARSLTLFINHLKSKLADSPADVARSNNKRQRQAEAVSQIVHARFPGTKFDKEFFAVIGDFNDQPASLPVQPLETRSDLVDIVKRIDPPEERWTHWWRGKNIVSQLDYVLASPALDKAITSIRIERQGIGFERHLASGGTGPVHAKFNDGSGNSNTGQINFQFPRYNSVTPTNYASDHCPVIFTVE